MQTLIKDIIGDKRLIDALENHGMVYVGQLLILTHEELLKLRGVGMRRSFKIVAALAKHKYPTLGSVKAHSLPSVVLLHMAELAAREEARKREEEEEFVRVHGCTMSEFWASRPKDWGFAPDDEEYDD